VVPLPVDLRRYPGIRRLATDYAHNFPAVASFFSGDPRDRAAWTQTIARVQAHGRQPRALASLVQSQQQRRGAPPRAVDAGRLLADARTVAVVTGQQAGLFGGPLFTLLKALTALKLAEQVARDHQVPTVAVFWIDAEDHDWDEVRTCGVFDEALAARTVALPPRSDRSPKPVSAARVDASIDPVFDELERVLPPTEFRAALLADLRAAYEPGTGMAEAFGRWLERLLGPRGLVVFDSSDEAAKPLAKEIFVRELSAPGTTSRLAARAGSDLEARGYHAQVQTTDEGVALFRLNGGRHPIHRSGDGFLVEDTAYPAPGLLHEAEVHPAAFSPSVLLRPVVQDALFPTVCYVPGPNELGYLGQLRTVYEHFGVPMPLMHPRASATLLDTAAVRFLTKCHLPLEALQAQDEASLNDVLAREIPAAVEESFAAVTATVGAQMVRLIESLPAVDPTLEGAGRSTLKRMEHDLETLHGKILQAVKRRHETLRRQFLRTRALAFPDGHAQERAIGFVSFLNLHGPALVDRLAEELPLDLGQHWVITV
jgi:bacillithiol biosynthesis cysteine-adding enzyme BshC